MNSKVHFKLQSVCPSGRAVRLRDRKLQTLVAFFALSVLAGCAPAGEALDASQPVVASATPSPATEIVPRAGATPVAAGSDQALLAKARALAYASRSEERAKPELDPAMLALRARTQTAPRAEVTRPLSPTAPARDDAPSGLSQEEIMARLRNLSLVARAEEIAEASRHGTSEAPAVRAPLASSGVAEAQVQPARRSPEEILRRLKELSERESGGRQAHVSTFGNLPQRIAPPDPSASVTMEHLRKRVIAQAKTDMRAQAAQP